MDIEFRQATLIHNIFSKYNVYKCFYYTKKKKD